MDNELIKLTDEKEKKRLKNLLEKEKNNNNELSLEELKKLRKEIEKLNSEIKRRKSVRDVKLDTSTFNNIEIDDVSYEQQARENIQNQVLKQAKLK